MWAFFMERRRGMNERKPSSEKGVRHPFAPVADARASVLVLGSFPSVKSRENAFYYGHPQNRFWRVLAALLAESVPQSIEEKTAFLHRSRIALWDVVAACDITGSADSALTPLSYNDVASLVKDTEIRYIFANGQTAGKLYRKHLEPLTAMPLCVLPSTSPANAAWPLEKLIAAWQPLADAL
jgi:double-stranded uracil-DNA glycosylase